MEVNIAIFITLHTISMSLLHVNEKLCIFKKNSL